MTISANNIVGLIYGMQSIFQALPAARTNGLLSVPSMDIKGFPRFKWRGMHLDVSRHFVSPEFVLTTEGQGCTIHFTTDNSEPKATSQQYSAPFVIDRTCTARVISICNG